MFRTYITVLLITLLVGCSWVDEKFPERKKTDYKVSRTESSLEIPPDLTKPDQDSSMMVPDISPSGTASYSEYTGERSAPQPGQASTSRVMPEQKNIEFMRAGRHHWLVMQGSPDQVWDKVRAFWLENGFLLTIDNPAIGIMETEWAENRADIPQGPIRRLISKALDSLYSAATRDKFRVRLEKGQQEGTTELFLTHKGMEEIAQETQGSSTGTIWKPRPADPELEIEMLKQMLVFVGAEEQKAQRILASGKSREEIKARMITAEGGEAALLFEEPFSRAWRYVGLALDRVGFNVEDRDRSRGTYYVRYRDPEQDSNKKPGFFSRLAFWSDDDKIAEDQYQVFLLSEVNTTRISVRDKNGKADNSETARRILTMLQEQLQ